MKIKKEALTVKPSVLGGGEKRLHNGLANKTDHNIQSTVMDEIVVDKSVSVLSDSSLNPNNNLQETSTNSLQNSSTNNSATAEQWHHTGILHQALLQISSRHIEKPPSSISKASVLPKLTGSLLPSVDVKMSEGLPSVSVSVSETPLSHATFSTDRSYSAPLESLPSVSSPFGSLTYATLPTVSLTSDCTPETQSTLPLLTRLQTCDVALPNTSSTLSSGSSTTSVCDRSSSVSITASDISTSIAPVPQLCQAIASVSSKDDAVTVVYSSIPKIEPSGSHLIHNIQKTVPLPPMSEVKSSLSNHLNSLPHTQNKTDNILHNKSSVPLPDISPPKSNPHGETLGFSNIPAADVVDAITTIKLDGSSDSSEFGGNSTLSLPSASVKFSSDSSSSDLTSSIVIPVSSDVILTKIDGQNSNSSQDISHIITIPLPAGTVYNSSLIPMSLPLCNGNTSGVSSSMTSAVVPNMPYSVTGISQQGSSTCWPTTAVAVSVTSNTHQATSVTTSLPVSVMSVTSTLPSVQASNMIHLTCNSVSLPPPSLSTSTVMSTLTQDPICYTVQSPAEILSQLSKAGALPTMSSSQVSSVLSALGSETSVDMESDSAHHNEMINSQVLHVDKVSTLTQTDALEMNIMPNDEKIIQLFGGQQLLEHVMVPSGGHPQSQSIPPEVSHETSTINHSDLVPVDVTEPKQPYPRIVAMVLNTSIMGNDKLSDVQRLQGTMFKDTEIQIENHDVEPDADNCEMLRNYLVLPNNIKPPRKRTKRTSALREMLLGMSGSSDDKESQSKKPRGRPKKSKSDSASISISEVKTVDSNLEVHWNGSNLTQGFTKESECYKCVYCPFISLDKNNMVVHIKLKHSSEVDVSVVRQELKCPGCPNVFFTTNSLEVHLKQDHQVNAPELKAITSSVIKTAVEGKIKFAQQNHKKKKRSERKKSLNNGELKIASVNPSSTHCLTEILDDSANDVSVMDITGCLMMSAHNDVSEVTLSEGCRVQVRNLSNEVELSEGETSSKKEKSTNNAGLDICEPEATEDAFHENLPVPNGLISVVPSENLSSGSGKSGEQKRKRGRPKGSKTTTLRDKDGQNSKKSSGHRCNIDNCAVTLRSPENIEYHRSCHYEAEFHCPECPHTHSHWDGMSIHLWRSHMVDMELYTCDQCNYKTNSYAKLINLHKWIHGSERPFLCDSCGKGFKNRKQLRNHKAVHQPKQSKVGECEVCGRAFTNKRLLRMHLDNVHNKLRPHLCNYCGYSASSVSSLKMHMRKHTGEKPFRCQLCDYCTADHNSLRRHKMRHTGDKPYKCPHCPYACIQSSTYKAHLKTKHPGMDDGLMFSCNLCSFRSVKEENYIAHLAEHKQDARGLDRHNDAEKQVAAGAEKTAKRIEERPLMVSMSSQMPLFSNADPGVEERFDLGVQSDSVIHLVVSNESPEHFSVVKLDSMDSTSDVQMSLESDFEGEVITGDLPEDLPSETELITGDLNEPQEFKVCASELKMKTHQDVNAAKL